MNHSSDVAVVLEKTQSWLRDAIRRPRTITQQYIFFW